MFLRSVIISMSQRKIKLKKKKMAFVKSQKTNDSFVNTYAYYVQRS